MLREKGVYILTSSRELLLIGWKRWEPCPDPTLLGSGSPVLKGTMSWGFPPIQLLIPWGHFLSSATRPFPGPFSVQLFRMGSSGPSTFKEPVYPITMPNHVAWELPADPLMYGYFQLSVMQLRSAMRVLTGHRLMCGSRRTEIAGHWMVVTLEHA